MRLILPHVSWVFCVVTPLMLTLRSQKDRERATYGLKEAGIAKAYIGAPGLDKHSRDAVRMIKWKQPTKENVRCAFYSFVG